MYCWKCGELNEDSAIKCTRCGEVLQPVPQPSPPQDPSQAPQPVTQPTAPPVPQPAPMIPVAIPNHLVQAILVTVLCCLPCGIAAIVYASQVNTKVALGDVAGALESSKKAGMWSWIGFGLGLLGGIVYGIVMAMGILASRW